MEGWKDNVRVLYTGKAKPFAVTRNDTLIEADSVEELIEAIRQDAKVGKGTQIWITRNGKHFQINGGRMPDGKLWKPKVGSVISVKCKSRNPEHKTERINYTVVSPANFKGSVAKAKGTLDKDISWRVDDTHSTKDYKRDRLYKTDKGSTIAITQSGDIISVCKHKGDNARGSDLLQFAVKQGGKKLDSFSGNYEFYVKNGFEPVSWTPFNKEYAPHDWREGRDKEEPVIFFKYTGKKTTMTAEEFYKTVKPCTGENGYDEAMNIRDKSM